MGRVITAIALGSNLGDRGAHLAFALERLPAWIHDARSSRVRETAPEGAGPQPPYLNAVMVGVTILAPDALLDVLLQLEHERGRERPARWAPRTLDLDLILHGETVVSSDRLTLPHPRFRDRGFVLEPLAEIAPDLVDPVTELTMRALWERYQLLASNSTIH
jgi:2-amino-4-hydroxy-6-hydroxymethyldihydropteridine diphosphokinase